MRVEAAEPGGEGSQVLVGEPVGLEAEGQQCGEQGVGAWLSQAQPGDAGAGRCGDRVGDGGQGGGSGDRVMVESLDAQQASVGGEATRPRSEPPLCSNVVIRKFSRIVGSPD